jgi:hypothetical protein
MPRSSTGSDAPLPAPQNSGAPPPPEAPLAKPAGPTSAHFALLKDVAIILLGCGVNNISLEFIVSVKRNPYADKDSAGLLTFLQFAFIALFTLPSQLEWRGWKDSGGPLRVLAPKVPVLDYAMMAVLFFLMSILNNGAR